MNTLRSALITLALISLMSCSASIEATGGKQKPKGGGQKAIKNQQITGKLFGKSWKATSAGYREYGDGERLVTIANDGMDPCFSFGGVSETYISFGLPEAGEKKKFVTDPRKRQSEATVVFVHSEGSSVENYVADYSTVQIFEESTREMHIGIYGHFEESSGRVSEVNGRIEAINCDTQMTFQNWNQFAGAYLLTEFDGRELSYQEQQPASISLDQNTYADENGDYLTTLSFPLYFSVNSGTATSIDIGPFEHLGMSWKEETTRGMKYRYQLDTVLYDGSQAYPTLLDLTVEDNGTNKIFVKYQLSIDGFISEKKHNLVFEKVSY